MDWSKVEKRHVEAAIEKFIKKRPEYPEPRSYYLIHNGEKLPSKYIRGLAYSLATGESFTLGGFSGGTETVDFFKKFGYSVIQITKKEETKYSVIDAVWIAAALMSAEKYDNNPNVTRDDMYFRQSDIVKRAQTLTDGTIHSPRVSTWLNADNSNSSHNYLRADQKENPASRRLSMMYEFPEKTYPANLNLEDTLTMNDKPYTMGDLIDFVRDVYPEVMKKMQTIDIDYIAILDYLQNNQEVPYSNPEAIGIDQAEKERLLSVKEKGQAAVAELKKIAARCEQLFGLDKCLPLSWLDGSNTKTRKNLWAQMKYKEYENDPVSVSLFVEKDNGATRYRISLGIKDDGTNRSTMERYHSHLDMPIQDGMVYVAGSDQWGNPYAVPDNVEKIKEQLNNRKLRKVQLCIYVESIAGKTNGQFDKEIMDAVEKIIPYYEHVIGKEKASNRAWLLTWNPSNWDWDNYKEWCADSKKGKKHTEPWTCQSKQPVIGDEIFLMKTGEKPRGIIAHGFVSKAAYESDHYDPAKAFQGKTANHIDAEFDWIQDFEIESILMQDALKEKMPTQEWSPMASGIEIKEPALTVLREMWQDLNTIDNNVSFDKNMILYGPPGTGKTYSTAIYAVAICSGISVEEIKKWSYSKVMDKYKDLKEAGRVAFTTFHQSYGYEEFIEGIKPVVNEEESSLGYTIEPGVFKKFCKKAEIPEQKDFKFTGTIWNIRSRANDSDVKFDYEEYLFSEGAVIVEDIEDQKRQCNFLPNMAKGDLVVLGREFCITGVGIVIDDTLEKIDKEPFFWKRNVEWLAKNLHLTFSDIGMAGGCISNFAVAKSKIKVQHLSNIITRKEEPKPYVFVIDEINRGNISKIFGELITLIEDTKRKGMEEQASAILPYSNEPFSVPSNVYILGAMNTADRSIALMDTALRRRFQFVEMMPDANVIREIGADKVDDLDVAEMLEIINERITFLYGREHTIGHAFFTKLKDSPTIETLASIFEKSVIPLLQEYFYEDYQKIQLVLGDNGKTDPLLKFIRDEEVKVKSIFKGNPDDVVDLPEKKYSINKDALKNIESYKQIK